MNKAIIDKSVRHQDIGGKEITLEKKFTLAEAYNDVNISSTWAFANLVRRRKDIMKLIQENPTIKLFYGHVGLFGYYVLEDEITVLE